LRVDSRVSQKIQHRSVARLRVDRYSKPASRLGPLFASDSWLLTSGFLLLHSRVWPPVYCHLLYCLAERGFLLLRHVFNIRPSLERSLTATHPASSPGASSSGRFAHTANLRLFRLRRDVYFSPRRGTLKEAVGAPKASPEVPILARWLLLFTLKPHYLLNSRHSRGTSWHLLAPLTHIRRSPRFRKFMPRQWLPEFSVGTLLQERPRPRTRMISLKAVLSTYLIFAM